MKTNLSPVRREDEDSEIFPNVIDIEASLLGALLISPREILNVMTVVQVEDFYRDFYREVYATMLRLYTEHQSFDIVLLEDELKKKRTLSLDESSELTAWVREGILYFNAREYAQRVADTAIRRRIVEGGHTLFQLGHTSTDAHEALASAEQLVYSIGAQKHGSEISTFRQISSRFVEELDHRRDLMKQGIIAGLSTGFPVLDQMTSGFRKGHLIILGALSSDGKSALALNFGLNVAKQGKQVLIFSMEMPEDEVMQRILANYTGLDNTDIGNGNYTDEEWDQKIVPAMGKIEELPISIDETPSLTVAEIRAKCIQEAMRLRSSGGLGLVIVDYLQLIQPPVGTKNETRANVISEIARDLKILAGQLGVPILCPAQLTREVDKPGRIPNMSDLGESSGLEKNANAVLMIYRPSRHDPTADPRTGVLIVAKCRNGRRGNVGMTIDLSKMRFLPCEMVLQEGRDE